MAVRVAMVAACPFPSPQGSQVFVGQMCEHLARRGHDVHLLTYGQGRGPGDLPYRHHRIRRLAGDGSMRSGPSPLKPLLDLMMVQALARLVRDQSIEIIHAHNYEATVVALAVRALSGVPVVYHSHNLMGDELPTYFGNRVARLAAAAAGKMLDRQVPRRADHSIALCEYTGARLVEAGVPGDRISVVPPAVADEGVPGGGDGARQSFGLRTGLFVAGYCGNLDAYQNLELLLASFAWLRDHCDPAEAGIRLLVATHSRDDRFDDLVRRRGLGALVTVAELEGFGEARRAIAACDVLLLPRRLGSGYPIKLLNYMSAAKAVISAGCGSKVLTDGVDGRVVPDDSPAALGEAILHLSRAPETARALGAAARETFLDKLTWDSVLPRIESIYETLRGSVEPRRHDRASRADRCLEG